MTDLDRLEKDMLDSMRSELSPSAADRTRVGAALGSKLGVLGLLTVSTPSREALAQQGAAHAGSTAGLSWTAKGLAKALLAGVVVTGAGVAAVVWSAQSSPGADTHRAARAPITISEPERPRPPRALAPAPAPVPDAPPAVERDDSSSAASAAKAASPSRVAASTSDLEGELRLLRKANQANSQNRPAAALELLDEAAARYPTGRLTEERQAVRVIATCKLGASGAAIQQARRFTRRYKNSVYRGRVKAACGLADDSAAKRMGSSQP